MLAEAYPEPDKGGRGRLCRPHDVHAMMATKPADSADLKRPRLGLYLLAAASTPAELIEAVAGPFTPLAHRRAGHACGRRYSPDRWRLARLPAPLCRGTSTPGAYARAWGCSFAFSLAPTPGARVLTLPTIAWPP